MSTGYAETDIRHKLRGLPNHHGGNGYAWTDLFTVRHAIISRLKPAPTSVFEFGALVGYFLATALDAAPSISRVGWVDLELHTPLSNALCSENVRHIAPCAEVAFWPHRDDMPDGLQYDVVQVDSDHSYDGCLNDLLAAEKLKPSWIFMDDWTASPHIEAVQSATRDWRKTSSSRWRIKEYETVNGLAVLTKQT